MKKLNTKKTFSKKNIIFANQCVTPTNCSACKCYVAETKIAKNALKKLYA